MPKLEKKPMATEDRIKDALSLLKGARPDQVEILDNPNGGIEIHFFPMKTPEERAVASAFGAEERNRLILEMEKQMGGRGEEDSEEWIRMIKESRTFSKAKTYDFS